MKQERRHIVFYIFILLIIVSSGCETDVDNVGIPPFQQKLVINSFISPSDTTSYFYVSTNRKLFGELNTEPPLGILSGSISDDITEVPLDTATKGLKFSNTKMQVKYGTTYRIKISSESGLMAEGICTVPMKRNFEIKLDTFSVLRQVPAEMQSQSGITYRSIDFKVTFQDVPNEENFYRISSERIIYFTNHATMNSYTMEGSLSFENEFITDNGLDGNKIVVNTVNGSYFFSSSTDSVLIKIYLYHTEKSYFQYHKSLNDYNDGENPFSEATPVYSNIIGGLGVFTSYTIDSLIVKLK